MRPILRAYILLATLTIFGQWLVVWVGGSAIRPSPAGLTVFVLLLIWLARGSRVAWTLLLAWNGLMLVAVIALMTPAVALALALVLHIGSLVLLLGPSIRHQLGRRSRPSANLA